MDSPAYTALAPDGSALPQAGGKRPVIGISGASSDSKSVAAVISQLRAVGAEPVFLGDHTEKLKAYGGNVQAAVNADLARLDGLMVMGSDGDIEPAKYGEKRHPKTTVDTNVARVTYEEAAMQKALDSGMPLLGICGSLQRLNVMGGGSLYQHVPDIVGDNHHEQREAGIAPFVPVQVVSVVGGTHLAAIGAGTDSVYTPTHSGAPPGVVMENSMHHQAVHRVRDDFQVNAISSDGIIEGIEPKAGSRYANQYVMGIQWHPEFGASDLGPKIAGSITQAAKAYAKKKQSAENVELNRQGRWNAAIPLRADAPPPPQLALIDPSMIRSDPDTYQFRSGGNAQGVIKNHGVSDKWDPILGCDPIIVHQHRNGEYFIADGHHRLDLAQRTNAQGTGPGKLIALVLREEDGYTATDVKAIAAYKNLHNELARNGNTPTDLADGARVMHEARTLVDHPKWLPSLKMDTRDCHLCESLSKLSDKSLDRVAKQQVPVEMAALIAETTPGAAQQDQALGYIADRLAQNYTVSVTVNGLPVQGKSFMLVSKRDEKAPPPPPEAVEASHAARILQRRAMQAQQARAH